MGVSGAGKSTSGRMLADYLRWPVADADDFHSRSSVSKMASGIPLDENDRGPWLAALRKYLLNQNQQKQSAILACSALKLEHRKQLSIPGVRFVFLNGSKELIAGRLSERSGHYMPPELLDSQFCALEEPSAGEEIVRVSIDDRPEKITRAIISLLGLQDKKTTP